MNADEIRAVVLDTLATVAPETDPAAIRADRLLRAELELDSMDWLNVIEALHEGLAVDIPETDYGKLGTLDEVVAYLAGRLGVPAGE